jgi:hypothetical protein
MKTLRPLFFSLLLSSPLAACAADGADDADVAVDDDVDGDTDPGDPGDPGDEPSDPAACPVRAEFRDVDSYDLGHFVEGAYYEQAEAAPAPLGQDGACAILERVERAPTPFTPLELTGPSRSYRITPGYEGGYYLNASPAEGKRPLVASMAAVIDDLVVMGASPLERQPGPLAIHEHQPLAITWDEADTDSDAELVLRLDNLEHGEHVYLECVVPVTDRELTVSSELVDQLFEISRSKAGPHLERAVVAVRQRTSAPVEDDIGGCAVLDSEFRYELEQDMIPAGSMPGDD